MFVFISILIIITLLFLCLQIGILVSPKITKKNVYDILPLGFVVMFSVFHGLYLPMYFADGNKILFYALFCIFILIAIILPFFIRRPQYKQFFTEIKEYLNGKILFFVIVLIAIILWQIVMRCYFQRTDTDDTLYVAWSEASAKFSHFIKVNPTFNIPEIKITPIYQFNSWEVFIGMLCSFTGINAASMTHSVMPAFVIILSYLAISALALRMTNKPQKVIFFTLGVAFFFLYITTSMHTGYFLLTRSWFGKSLVANFSVAMIICFVLDFYRTGANSKFAAVIKTMLVGFASVGLNVTAVFLLPTLCVLIFCAGGLIRIKNKILKVSLIIFPLMGVILTVMFFSSLPNPNVFKLPDNFTFDFFANFNSFIKNGIYFTSSLVIGILCLINARKSENRMNAASILFYLPLLFFLFIGNPYISPLFAYYITTPYTFYRIFWVLPIPFAIGYLIMQSASLRTNIIFRTALTAAIVVGISLSGMFIYTMPGRFMPPENTEKLPQTLIELNNYIEKDIEKVEFEKEVAYKHMSPYERKAYDKQQQDQLEHLKKTKRPAIISHSKLAGTPKCYSLMPQISSDINYLISQTNYDNYFVQAGYSDEYIAASKVLRSISSNPNSHAGKTRIKYSVYITDVDYIVSMKTNKRIQYMMSQIGVKPAYSNSEYVLFDMTQLKEQMKKNPPKYKYPELTGKPWVPKKK